MNIRLAQENDLQSIQTIIESAFSDEESQVISDLVYTLFNEFTTPPIKSLIAELDNQVIGYVSFSPIFLKSNSSLSVYILAPLAVSSKQQRRGIGSNLIKSGVEMLVQDNVDVLLVYGDPKYYRQFGFEESIGSSFIPPYSLKHPAGWLGMMLNGTTVPNEPIRFDCVQSLHNPDLW